MPRDRFTDRPSERDTAGAMRRSRQAARWPMAPGWLELHIMGGGLELVDSGRASRTKSVRPPQWEGPGVEQAAPDVETPRLREGSGATVVATHDESVLPVSVRRIFTDTVHDGLDGEFEVSGGVGPASGRAETSACAPTLLGAKGQSSPRRAMVAA